MSVLTRIQTQYQEVLPILNLPSSTMLKLTAMEWLVHLPTQRKNSPVQFVPSKVETTIDESNFSAAVLTHFEYNVIMMSL